MQGRPKLFTSYEADASIFPTSTQRWLAFIGFVILLLMPFNVPFISGGVPDTWPGFLQSIPILSDGIPFVRFLGDSNWIRPMTEVFIFGVAALGLNILTGVGGQVSLGHSFFMGAGACTAAVLGGEPGGRFWGMGFPIWVWLPAAGVVAAVIGIAVSPTAVKLRGLYLGIVTLGLVFIGVHLSRVWPQIAGDTESGRKYPEFDLRLWGANEDQADSLFKASTGDFDATFPLIGDFTVTEETKVYYFTLFVCVVMAVLAKNIMRSRTGRALQAIRDRDIAAEVMGVDEAKYKRIAFAISSFYAGIAGAMFGSFLGKVAGNQFDIFLAVEFIAILLIGGAGTVSGALAGTFFVVILPESVKQFTEFLEHQQSHDGLFIWDWLANILLTEGPGDLGPISTASISPGWALGVFDWNVVIYGALIVVFLIFEPHGLFGIWVKIRNYWKGWPFSY